MLDGKEGFSPIGVWLWDAGFAYFCVPDGESSWDHLRQIGNLAVRMEDVGSPEEYKPSARDEGQGLRASCQPVINLKNCFPQWGTHLASRTAEVSRIGHLPNDLSVLLGRRSTFIFAPFISLEHFLNYSLLFFILFFVFIAEFLRCMYLLII